MFNWNRGDFCPSLIVMFWHFLVKVFIILSRKKCGLEYIKLFICVNFLVCFKGQHDEVIDLGHKPKLTMKVPQRMRRLGVRSNDCSVNNMAVSEFVSFLFLEIFNDESELEFTHVHWCMENEINFIYYYSKRQSVLKFEGYVLNVVELMDDHEPQHIDDFRTHYRELFFFIERTF